MCNFAMYQRRSLKRRARIEELVYIVILVSTRGMQTYRYRTVNLSADEYTHVRKNGLPTWKSSTTLFEKRARASSHVHMYVCVCACVCGETRERNLRRYAACWLTKIDKGRFYEPISATIQCLRRRSREVGGLTCKKK